MKIKIGDKEYEVAKEIGDAFMKMKKGMKDMQDDLDEAIDIAGSTLDDKTKKDSDNSELTKITAQRDALLDQIEKYDDIEAKLEKEDDFKNRLKEYNYVIKNAERILEKDALEKLDGDIDAIKEAVVRADSKHVDTKALDNKIYLNARFDSVVERLDKSVESKSKAGKNIIKSKETRSDDKENNLDVAEEARKRSLDYYKESQEKRKDKMYEEEDFT